MVSELSQQWSQYLNPGRSDDKTLSFNHSAPGFSAKPLNEEPVVRLKISALSQPLSGSVLGGNLSQTRPDIEQTLNTVTWKDILQHRSSRLGYLGLSPGCATH